MRTRSAGARSGSAISPTPRPSKTRLDQLLLHHNALLRGLGKPEIDRGALLADLRADRAARPALCRHGLAACSTRRGARAGASCSRARRARCSMSTTAPIRSSPRPTPWPARRRPGRGSRRARSAMCSASPRPIRPGSAAARSRPSWRTRSASGSASAGASSASSPGASDAAAGSMRSWCARRSRPAGSTASRSPSSTCSTVSTSSRSAPPIAAAASVYDYFPAGTSAQAEIEPVYETADGWRESTRGARSWADLPATAIKYIRRIEELIEAPVALLSTSPERDDTVLVRDPFAD